MEQISITPGDAGSSVARIDGENSIFIRREPLDAKPASPRTTGKTADKNRLKPCLKEAVRSTDELELKLTGRIGEIDRVVFDYLKVHPKLGNITMLWPDGSQAPGSPFNGGGSTWGPWGAAIDGNDQVWISNFVGGSITHL